MWTVETETIEEIVLFIVLLVVHEGGGGGVLLDKRIEAIYVEIDIVVPYTQPLLFSLYDVGKCFFILVLLAEIHTVRKKIVTRSIFHEPPYFIQNVIAASHLRDHLHDTFFIVLAFHFTLQSAVATNKDE